MSVSWLRSTAVAAIFVAAAGLLVARPAAAADEAGRAVFASKCAVCHATEPEFHKEGPSLAGTYGREAGTAPFFPGYRGLKGAEFVWDDQTLDAWLADPRGFLGGKDTSMTLRLPDPAERSAVIAYLKTLR